jgi:hypothetical protein
MKKSGEASSGALCTTTEGGRTYDGTESEARADATVAEGAEILYTWELVFGPSRRVIVDKQR